MTKWYYIKESQDKSYLATLGNLEDAFKRLPSEAPAELRNNLTELIYQVQELYEPIESETSEYSAKILKFYKDSFSSKIGSALTKYNGKVLPILDVHRITEEELEWISADKNAYLGYLPIPELTSQGEKGYAITFYDDEINAGVIDDCWGIILEIIKK